MPNPMTNTEDDEALWARAEQLAWDLLYSYDGAITDALAVATAHIQALRDGRAADSAFSVRLFAEAKEDCEAGIALAERVWRVLHTWSFVG